MLTSFAVVLLRSRAYRLCTACKLCLPCLLLAITKGSRSEAGRRWLERIWSLMSTCTQQGRSAFEFLAETVQLHFQGQPTPSLLPHNTS
jgi:hypothetical protein